MGSSKCRGDKILRVCFHCQRFKKITNLLTACSLIFRGYFTSNNKSFSIQPLEALNGEVQGPQWMLRDISQKYSFMNDSLN